MLNMDTAIVIHLLQLIIGNSVESNAFKMLAAITGVGSKILHSVVFGQDGLL
jgi:hypothetical protein